ncbi:sortase-like acyltransferase [Cladochytrium replicatum]|nr:sortase-like acyltransferase [Cladochytrium replicatum]
MLVRGITDQDIPAVLEIYTHYVQNSVATFELTPPSLADFSKRVDSIRTSNLPHLVATAEENPNSVLGYAYASFYRAERHAYRHTVEISIYLSHTCLRSGAGRALMNALVAGIRERQPHVRELLAVMAVDTVGSGVGVEMFYRKMGFEEVGKLKKVGYKFDRWIDVMFLQKSLVVEA